MPSVLASLNTLADFVCKMIDSLLVKLGAPAWSVEVSVRYGSVPYRNMV